MQWWMDKLHCIILKALSTNVAISCHEIRCTQSYHLSVQFNLGLISPQNILPVVLWNFQELKSL